ncbi:MAG: hypothetical protein ACP5UM_02960 [Anaerolineae bacterium]
MLAYRRLAFLGALVGLGATGGLVWVVSHYPPTGMAVVAFFLLAFLAATGWACPAMAFLNRRFAGPDHSTDALRQSAWVGLLVALGLWLQAMRVLTWTAFLLLVAVLALAELFILRARKK